ncbi:MAG TPA: TadE family protein [Dehalococcoidia bacterium]|nr:TadE family protein [Dehalococcoidia bacterium]
MREDGKRLALERGQALIEFAFVLPILLLFLLTLVDFGIALDRREVIQHAVREGSRQGAIGLDESGVIDVTVNQSQGTLDAGEVEVCYDDGPSGESAGSAGSWIRVSADYTYEFSVGGELLGAIGIDPASLSINMTPHADSRLETSMPGGTAC